MVDIILKKDLLWYEKRPQKPALDPYRITGAELDGLKKEIDELLVEGYTSSS
jgi:hypothetical protein